MGEKTCLEKGKGGKAMKDRQEDLSVRAGQKVINQMAEIFSQLKRGSLDTDHLQALIDHKNPFEAREYPDWEFILRLFGRDNVIVAKQSAGVWGLESPKDDKVLYSKATLRHAAKENEQGEDWRLVYINGLSLREQREKRGVNRAEQPCFDTFANDDWWLESDEDKWATFRPQTGYYLINFRGQFANMNWVEQGKAITELGAGYERCHEAAFAEAILTIFMVNNGERIAEDWYHWGATAASNDNRVGVGVFGSGGLIVSGGLVDCSDDDLRVVLSRKFSF
ncbi:MAG: hypothetical protein PHC97_02515 [Patescibacteria group bacterium]|nr:hypothetical protein [Patescibacteria group bacterium]